MNFTGGIMFQTFLFALENNISSHNSIKPAIQVTNVSDTMRCYGIYGCFSIAYPWMSEHRMVAYFPASPKDLNVRFPTFTKHNMKIPYFLDPNQPAKIRMRKFNTLGPFFFIAHGYLGGGNKPWIQKMTETLLSLKQNVNGTVIIIDWREASSPPYSKAVGNIRLLGTIAAHLINDLYVHLSLKDLDNFHFIGHSLGSHLGGYAGAVLQEKFGLKLGRITGLDPAEPHFQQRLNEIRLDPSDAKFVDIVHTDATLFISGGLGIFDSIGHVDFFPNGGHDQPGCDKNFAEYVKDQNDSFYGGLEKYLSCSHSRSYDYFIESIDTLCPFLAITCPSYKSFEVGSCFQCGIRGQSCIRFGYHSNHGYQRMIKNREVNENKPINAYLLAGRTGPYCRLHYRITLNMSSTAISSEHIGDTGRVSINFIHKNGELSEKILLDEHNEPHKHGTQKTIMVTSKDTSIPESIQVEFKHEKSLLNPLTWRMSKSQHIYVAWIHIESLEHRNNVTVCPVNHAYVSTETPSVFHKNYCKDIFPIELPPTYKTI